MVLFSLKCFPTLSEVIRRQGHGQAQINHLYLSGIIISIHAVLFFKTCLMYSEVDQEAKADKRLLLLSYCKPVLRCDQRSNAIIKAKTRDLSVTSVHVYLLAPSSLHAPIVILRQSSVAFSYLVLLQKFFVIHM